MDFKDLARSGTAPEPSKTKLLINNGDNNMNNYNNSISLLGTRPKTRSLDNDINDFNIDLRSSNKITNYAQNSDKNKNLSDENKIFKRLQEEEEYLKAIENFQAAVEDWSGRKDIDVVTTNSRQNTASSSIRPTKQQQEGKLHTNIVHSAYTQNIPNIILQTSKKSTDFSHSRPQTTARDRELRSINQQTHNNHISDIRAAYGADIMDKVISSTVSKPKSSSVVNKRNIQATRNFEDTNNNYESGNNNGIRYNTSIKIPDDYNGDNSKLPASVVDTKRPISNRINKYHHVSSGTKANSTIQDTTTVNYIEPTISRDIDSDGNYNSNNSNNGQKFSSGRKFPSSANKLLKASLAYNRKSLGNNAGVEIDLSTTIIKKTTTTSDYVENHSITLNADNNIMYEASNLVDSNIGNSAIRSNINKNTIDSNPINKDINNNFSPIHYNQNLRLSRGPSSSPIMIVGSDNEFSKSESEIFFVEVEDSDGLDSSFDDSPILAEYLKKQEQLKTNENNSHIKHTESSDNATISRPQSRKLYLGTGKESTKSSDTQEVANVITIQPRSAGAVNSSRKIITGQNNSDTSSMFEIPVLTKMNSCNDIFSSVNKNDILKNKGLEAKQNMINEGPRPPSRQSSAFPTHLIDNNNNNNNNNNSNERERNKNESEISKNHHNNKITATLHTDNYQIIEKNQYMDSSKVSDQSTIENTNRANKKDINTKISPTILVKSIKEIDHIILDEYDTEQINSKNDMEESTTSLRLKTSPNLNYNNNRPPSRQKVAAQHLFEGQPSLPSRGDTASNKSKRSSRTTTTTAAATAALHYNPQQDGFLDMVDHRDNDMPFKIKINYGTRNTSIEYEKSSKHIDGTQQKSDIRIRPNRSFDGGNIDTVNNLLDSTVRAIDISKPRSKTANTTTTSLIEGSSYRQGSSYLMHESNNNTNNNNSSNTATATAILLSTRESRSSNGSIYNTSSKLNSDRNKNNISGSYFNYNNTNNHQSNNNSGWTDAVDNDLSNKRSKIFTKRTNSAIMKKANELDRSERDISDDDGICYEDNDDHSIMTDDSGIPMMESMMSMHSITLESSLGEDFLSLFAPP